MDAPNMKDEPRYSKELRDLWSRKGFKQAVIGCGCNLACCDTDVWLKK